ncbi:MAG: HD domain-containing protein [Anaerolineaceae bacterium]|nr:HD domain-containing protein [Anaerolineaceae bacterium]
MSNQENGDSKATNIQEYRTLTGLNELSTGDIRLPVVLTLAETCAFEAGHTYQVTRLALCIFDQMKSLHHLGHIERFWLESAAILHDIGWVDGWRGHHKSSLRIILQTPMLPFTTRERLIIGSVARYHRKALPDEQHDHYNALGFHDRQVVKILAAILRIADGLDTTHQCLVKNILVKLSTRKVEFTCRVDLPISEESKRALQKADLMEMVFNKKVAVTWQIGD